MSSPAGIEPHSLSERVIVTATVFKGNIAKVKKTVFWCPMAVCVNKWHSNAMFGCCQFQKFNFACSLLKLLFYLTKLKPYYNGVFFCGLSTGDHCMELDGVGPVDNRLPPPFEKKRKNMTCDR